MPLRGRRATPATIPPSPTLLTGLAVPQALSHSCHDLHKMCAIAQANPGQMRPASREKPRRESGQPDPAGFIRPASPEAHPIAGNLEETSGPQAHHRPVFPWTTLNREPKNRRHSRFDSRLCLAIREPLGTSKANRCGVLLAQPHLPPPLAGHGEVSSLCLRGGQ